MKAGNDNKTDSEAAPNSTPVRLDVALAEALGVEATRPPEPSAILMLIVKGVMEAIARIGTEHPELARRVGLALVGPATSEAPVKRMTKTRYANRIGYCTRTLDKFIDAGLPTRGTKKRLRIDVREADAWLDQYEANQPDDVELLAMADAAKKRKKGGSRG